MEIYPSLSKKRDHPYVDGKFMFIPLLPTAASSIGVSHNSMLIGTAGKDCFSQTSAIIFFLYQASGQEPM